MAVFGVDGFACLNLELFARNCELDVPRTPQVHFDPRFTVVPLDVMGKGIDGDITIQLAVNAHKKVQVERRRHTSGIIVGGQKYLHRFDAIKPDQKLSALSQMAPHMPQKVYTAARHEIADGGTWKKAEAGFAWFVGRQLHI